MAAEKADYIHIGNIANNGYLNARILNRNGYPARCYAMGYTHIMGSPRWEEGRVLGVIGCQFRPDWGAVHYLGPSLPEWFFDADFASRSFIIPEPVTPSPTACTPVTSWVIGKLREKWAKLASRSSLFRMSGTAVEIFLRTRMEGAVFLKRVMAEQPNRMIRFAVYVIGHLALMTQRVFGPLTRMSGTAVRIFYRTRLEGAGFLKRTMAEQPNHLIRYAVYVIGHIALATQGKSTKKKTELKESAFEQLIGSILKKSNDDVGSFGLPVVLAEDLLPYSFDAELLKKIAGPKTKFIGYATDGIFPLLAGFEYNCFEHGTIRNLPFEDTPQGRMCRAVYKNARHVFITNADNNVAAQRLGLRSFSYLPHPINEDVREEARSNAHGIRQKIVEEFGDCTIVLHPARHHWREDRHTDWDKGNDLLIRAMGRLVEQGENIVLITVRFGEDWKKSEQLLAELNLSGRAIWLNPLPHHQFIEYILAADIVADQFNVPTFGSIPPKALYLGKAVLTSYLPEMHDWCYPEHPPFLRCNSSVESVENVLLEAVKNKAFVEGIGQSGKGWYEKYYSNKVILREFLKYT